MASAVDIASKPLPPGVIPASEFNPSSIDPNTHLFFDDDRKYIEPVQETMNKRELKVACVYCPPPESIVLHAPKTLVVVSGIVKPTQFRVMKQEGTPRGYLRDFLGDHMEKGIGTGFTIAMIAQLIDFERSSAAAESKRRRLYFFDFDRTLTYVPGMSFAFLPRKPKTRSTPTTEIDDIERVLLSQYAKYLFSDYCDEEPTEGSGGRMRLLRELFRIIGKERIYIVTANTSAKNSPDNPFYKYFKFLISELLPDFLEDHIVGVHSTNKEPLFNNKQDAIASIILQGSQRSPRSQRSQRSPRSPRSPGSPRSPRSPGGTVATKSPRSPKKTPSPLNGDRHGHGGRKRMSRKPYSRIRRYAHLSSRRRSTRKRHN